MHSQAIGTIVLMAFAASAVFGLCAMAGMAMHDGLCAGSGMSTILCAENPLRTISLLALVGYLLSFIAATVTRSRTVIVLDTPQSRRRKRTVLRWSPILGLQPLFSDGILDARLYA